MDSCFNLDFPECHWNTWLWRSVATVQIVFGTLGNTLNIIILLRRRLRKYSTTVYLVCLAVSDMSTLWVSTLPNIISHGFGVNVWESSQFCCKSLNWMSHTTAAYSIWLLVLLTVERMLLTRCPVFSRTSLTRRVSLITSSVCLFVITAMCAHYAFGLEIRTASLDLHGTNVTTTVCTYTSTKFKLFYKTSWALIILFVFNLIPVILIVISNAVILITIMVQRKRLSQVNPSGQAQKANSYKKTKSSTKLIFLISIFFIFTTLPYTINRAVSHLRPSTDTKGEAKRYLFDSVMLLLLYCNFTFNFVLYFVSGTIFYQELQAFISECRHRMIRIFEHQPSTEPSRTNVTRALPTNNEDPTEFR